MNLADLIEKERSLIVKYLELNQDNWNNYIKIIKNNEKTKTRIYDEKFWTYLLACGYAISKRQGIKELTEQLTLDNKLAFSNDMKIWLEAQPYPPRKDEGNTHLDLAIGMIEKRSNSSAQTKSGIRLKMHEFSWICFCEMKWNSDISLGVTHDIYRNQLVRIIENALTFQNYSNNSFNYSKTVAVTLVTPEALMGYKSRLYSYKFEEYSINFNNIILDLNNTSLLKRDESNWKYPIDINSRASRLKLNWVSYDSLFENIPDSILKDSIIDFYKTHK